MRKLTPRQDKFCIEYMKDLNGAQAAIRAGYSKKGANVTASQLLSNPNISHKLARLSQAHAGRADISVQRVLEELACIAFLDPLEIFNEDGSLKPIKDMSEAARRTIGGLEVKETWDRDGSEPVRSTISKVKIIDKGAALERLGKYLKMFTERHEITSPDGSMSPTTEAAREAARAAILKEFGD